MEALLTQQDGLVLTDRAGQSIVLFETPTPVPSRIAHGVADYADRLLALLPSGRVWPREPGAVIPQAAAGMAPSFARLDARAAALLQDAPAGDLVELLPEWEATLGLPDPCAGEQPTIELRQRSVRAQIAARGGQSIPYFVALALALGFAVTVDEFAPARADVLAADDPVYGPDWADTWRITLPALSLEEFAADESYADDPLASWGSKTAECTLGRYAPGHTILQFAYV